MQRTETHQWNTNIRIVRCRALCKKKRKKEEKQKKGKRKKTYIDFGNWTNDERAALLSSKTEGGRRRNKNGKREEAKQERKEGGGKTRRKGGRGKTHYLHCLRSYVRGVVVRSSSLVGRHSRRKATPGNKHCCCWLRAFISVFIQGMIHVTFSIYCIGNHRGYSRTTPSQRGGTTPALRVRCRMVFLVFCFTVSYFPSY